MIDLGVVLATENIGATTLPLRVSINFRVAGSAMTECCYAPSHIVILNKNETYFSVET
ncbi:MAG: hypothetical protein O4805_14375 [Trichodesmium sp. St16_bin2-tuft]|nr:hypothetical protein [Trichodesmium sp. St16_bin2-tuft]